MYWVKAMYVHNLKNNVFLKAPGAPFFICNIFTQSKSYKTKRPSYEKNNNGYCHSNPSI